MDSPLLRLLPSGRSVAVALALVLGGLGMYGLARGTSMFGVRTVEVDGASPALAAQVRRALRSFVGTSLLSLNGAALVGRTEDLPAVYAAAYDRDFPHTLRVRVVPELPVAVLRQGTSSWLVSARGRVIAVTDRLRFRSLPRIWLPTTVEVVTGAILADGSAGTVTRSLAVFRAAGFARGFAWARARDGLLTLGMRGGLELHLGRPVDLALKIAIARRILPLLRPPVDGGPNFLDETVPERPVAGRDPQLEG